MLGSVKSKNAIPNTPNQINEGTSVIGNMECEGHIRIDGNLEGEVRTRGKLVVGPKGKVSGNVFCNQLELIGTLTGNANVDEHSSLKTGCVLKGDIQTQTLSVEQGAVFQGNCSMGSPKHSGKNPKNHETTMA
jgi:cytoskeletal protein CcmA (bactofilin family)